MSKVLPVVMAFLISSFAHAGTVGDIDGNGQVGLPEAIYSLQSLAGMRPPLTFADQLEVISGYLETTGTAEQMILSVPSDKVFVLTDLIVSFSYGLHKFFLTEDRDGVQSTKLYVHYSDAGVNPLSLRSGITFAPGASIVIKTIEGAGKVMISGYLKP